MLPVRDSPRAQSCLHLWVEPFFGSAPAIQHREVDAPQCRGALQLAKNPEWDPRAPSIHCEQKPAQCSRVERVHLLEEADAVSLVLAEGGQHYGDVLAGSLQA